MKSKAPNGTEAKRVVDEIVKELLNLIAEQELTNYEYFTMLRQQYHKYRRGNMDLELFYDLSNYGFMLRSFTKRSELEQLSNKSYVFDTKEKNESKLGMEIPEIGHSICDDYKENAAFAAWCIYRAFFMNKVHANVDEFLQDVQYYLEALLGPKELGLTTTYEQLGNKKPYYIRSYHYPTLYDKEPCATAEHFLACLEEDYGFFSLFICQFKETTKSPLDEETQLRLLAYGLRLMPLPLATLRSLKELKASPNYFLDLGNLIESHWKYIKSLKKENLKHYYLHTVFYRRKVEGPSSFILEVLPETPRRFKEFLLEQRELLEKR